MLVDYDQPIRTRVGLCRRSRISARHEKQPTEAPLNGAVFLDKMFLSTLSSFQPGKKQLSSFFSREHEG
jgi:hypothetical protein